MKKITFFIMTLLLSIGLSSCGNSGSAVKRGQTVTIVERCIGAIDEDSYDEMTDKCVSKDERGLEIMDRQGRITILESGQQAFVVETGFGQVKIRLENDREYWCDNRFVK